MVVIGWRERTGGWRYEQVIVVVSSGATIASQIMKVLEVQVPAAFKLGAGGLLVLVIVVVVVIGGYCGREMQQVAIVLVLLMHHLLKSWMVAPQLDAVPPD